MLVLWLKLGHSQLGLDPFYWSADKSLAQLNFRCRRTESIMLLEANLLLRSNNVCLLPYSQVPLEELKATYMFHFHVRIFSSV